MTSGLSLDLYDGTAWVRLDDPMSRVNTVTAELASAFSEVLDEVQAKRAGLHRLVLWSEKPDNFVAGANLDMLATLSDRQAATALVSQFQALLDRLEALPLLTVAAIHGSCLGGGLELVLACRRRAATDEAETRLGLPEVQLGLLPGGGGTQRLPRLIGLPAALDLLLTGRQISARRAATLGLVDQVVATKAELREAVLKATDSPRRRLKASQWWLTHFAPGRWLTLSKARQQVAKRSGHHYPAPGQILEVTAAGLRSAFLTSPGVGFRAEAKAFGELLFTPVSEQLRWLFAATTELKKDSGTDDSSVEPRAVDRVAVLGGGLMGAGIAYLCAGPAKLPVVLKERDAEAAQAAVGRFQALLDGRSARKRLRPSERMEVESRFRVVETLSELAHPPLIIEAVLEDSDLKRALVRETLNAGRPGPAGPIFASNTSSIPIAELAAASEDPSRVIGMHYFSPADRMPLLEVVTTHQTHPEVVATCVEVGKRQGKTVIVVADGPGFYTSRILAPFLNEAGHMVVGGVGIGAVERALTELGFPVGPFKLLDEVGVDVGAKVAGILESHLGPRFAPPPLLLDMVRLGRLGRKSGRGFYRYTPERYASEYPHPGRDLASADLDPGLYRHLGLSAPSPSDSADLPRIALRCVLAMVNEAVHCLDQGIVRSPRDGDIGAVFGLGFPPYLGGPFRYCDARGARAIVDDLGALVATAGPRFTPAAGIARLAQTGGSFYGAAP